MFRSDHRLLLPSWQQYGQRIKNFPQHRHHYWSPLTFADIHSNVMDLRACASPPLSEPGIIKTETANLSSQGFESASSFSVSECFDYDVSYSAYCNAKLARKDTVLCVSQLSEAAFCVPPTIHSKTVLSQLIPRQNTVLLQLLSLSVSLDGLTLSLVSCLQRLLKPWLFLPNVLFPLLQQTW